MRHNRTILAVGQTAHQRIQNAHICVYGADPLGTEIVKSVLLFGANKISIFDDSTISQSDVDANMFVSDKDIGKNRTSVLKLALQRLNPNAQINLLAQKPESSTISQFSILVITKQISFDEICYLNNVCRENSVGFIVADTFSFSGFVFIDFGSKFCVENTNGKKPEQYRIQAISNASPGIIRFVGKQMPVLPLDSLIEFKGLASMTELNDIGPINLHSEDGILSLDCDTSSFSKFDRLNPSGFAVQVKKPLIREFQKYSESLDSPFHSTYFTDKHKYVRQFYLNRQKSLNIIEISELSPTTTCVESFYFPATTTLIAGITSNECLKFITHSLLPMEKQWFLFNNDDLFDVETKSTKSNVLDQLKDLNVAIIGVGATGCEAAKLFALCNVKSMFLIDSDSIETTNLNRQVLFSDDDVGKNKAEAAAETIRSFCHHAEKGSEMKIMTSPHFVNEETSSLFNDAWFKNLDAVWSMVDSFTARTYIDKRCAPLGVHSFTGGISKNTADWETMVPNFTTRYNVNQLAGSTSAASETPSCTLKLFPHRPEHCIEWAHHQLNRICQKKDDSLKTVENCIDFAVFYFVNKFNYRIKDFQHFHPRDETNNGALYWSNHRIYPSSIDEFTLSNSIFKKFIVSMTTLLANSNNINITEFGIDFEEHILPKASEKINSLLKVWRPPNDTEFKSFDEIDRNAQQNSVLDDLFLHDNETHIDFIESLSNLRSLNYGLGEINRLYAQEYAGKIDTAVSTTASICASGLFIEFLVSRSKPDNLCRGKYVSSPFSYMTFREPQMNKTKFGNTTDKFFTQWDFMDYNGDQSLRDVQKDIEEKANAKIFMWATQDGIMLPVDGGQSFGIKISTESTFDQLVDLLNSHGGSVQLEASFDFLPDSDVELRVPPIIIHFSENLK